MSELAGFIEGFISRFLADPGNNNLGPGTVAPAWDGFLLGFSTGDDELYGFWKEHIGPFHWTPAEAFALGTSGDKSTAGTHAGIGTADGPAQAGPVPPPAEDLTVVSWALCQTESTKAANREQTRFPSEPWARARIYGQDCNRTLHKALRQALAGRGCRAIAPALLRQAAERVSPTYGRAFTWSERHVAYTCGLGTFGLCGGLITERGQAVRFGSLVVHARIPPTPRPYVDPFAYCLFFNGISCARCSDRCPVGSIAEDGRDKEPCARHLQPVTQDFVRREYGFDGYGCGICQTAVPCESAIPPALRERPGR